MPAARATAAATRLRRAPPSAAQPRELEQALVEQRVARAHAGVGSALIRERRVVSCNQRFAAIYGYAGRAAPCTLVEFTSEPTELKAGLEQLSARECTVSADCARFSDRRVCAGWLCVDDSTILLAVFGDHTTVGMVRLFARETSASIGVILEETRSRPRRTGAFATPLTADEAGRAVDHRPA